MAWAEPTAAKIDETSTEICCSGDHPQAALFLLSLIVRPPCSTAHSPGSGAIGGALLSSGPYCAMQRNSHGGTLAAPRHLSGSRPYAGRKGEGPRPGGVQTSEQFYAWKAESLNVAPTFRYSGADLSQRVLAYFDESRNNSTTPLLGFLSEVSRITLRT
jgi:hypothetical protein